MKLHAHSCRPRSETARYLAVLAVGLTIFCFEFAGGIFSHSLALLSDSGHVFADNISVIVSIAVAEGVRRSSWPTIALRWRRFGAKINALLLLIPGILIIHESFERFAEGQSIRTLPMIAIAAIGGAGNYVQHLQLHRAEDKSHSTHKLLHLHVLSDLLQSASVVIAGAVIAATGWQIIDPLVSVCIGTMMMWWGLSFLFKRTDFASNPCRCGERRNYIPTIE